MSTHHAGHGSPEGGHKAMSAHAKSAPPRVRSELAVRDEVAVRTDDEPERSERSRKGSEPGASVWHIIEHELIDSRRYWISVVIPGILTPLLYVLALGIGLGTVVNRHGSSLGVPYLVFVAPAFLTAAALQTAASSATYPVMAGFKWVRYFHGMAATPLSTRQICDGKLVWIGMRTFANSAVYLAIMACFGAAERWQVMFAVLTATLTGVAFAAPCLALTAAVEAESQAFNVLARFIITPMFLFSGTFYPISQLPEWGRILAYISPLWHGTQLARGAAIGGMTTWSTAGHIVYLLVWLVMGTLLARWRFRVRLEI